MLTDRGLRRYFASRMPPGLMVGAFLSLGCLGFFFSFRRSLLPTIAPLFLDLCSVLDASHTSIE